MRVWSWKDLDSLRLQRREVEQLKEALKKRSVALWNGQDTILWNGFKSMEWDTSAKGLGNESCLKGRSFSNSRLMESDFAVFSVCPSSAFKELLGRLEIRELHTGKNLQNQHLLEIVLP
ncbi:hypothetical protein SUGI_0467140 [Cryptomeria japonica]|nr:hypothetical protein SUGI_0467140 [Cryptomeria japonica]